jgi:hypothetical protein
MLSWISGSFGDLVEEERLMGLPLEGW